MKKFSLTLVSLALVIATYLFLFPNDFFLPKSKFINNQSTYTYQRSFRRQTLFNKTLVSKQLLDIIKSPDSYFNKKNTIIKDNDKRTIAKLVVGSETVILKRYNIEGIYDWITKCPFRSSKAYRAWYYQHLLLDQGVSTAEPIAIIEKRWGPFWLQTYIVSKYIEGEPLGIKQNKLDPLIDKAICKQLVKYLNVFYHSRLLHRDLVARNIIISGDTVAIIDLDEMHSYAFNNRIFKNKFFQKHYYKFIHTSELSQDFIKTFLMTHNRLSDYNSRSKILKEPL